MGVKNSCIWWYHDEDIIKWWLCVCLKWSNSVDVRCLPAIAWKKKRFRTQTDGVNEKDAGMAFQKGSISVGLVLIPLPKSTWNFPKSTWNFPQKNGALKDLFCLPLFALQKQGWCSGSSCLFSGLSCWLHSGNLTLQWKNGPGLKMYFLFKNGDIPASYVNLAEGIHKWSCVWFWRTWKNVRFIKLEPKTPRFFCTLENS